MINPKTIFLIFGIVILVSGSSLILYDQYDKEGLLITDKENQHGQIPVMDFDKEYCTQITDKNYSGIKLNKEERAEMRDALDECHDNLITEREFSKIVYESCDQLWADYDGKIGIIVHSTPVRDWLIQEMKYCKELNTYEEDFTDDFEIDYTEKFD